MALRARRSDDWGYVLEVAAGYVWAAVAEYPWQDPLKGWIPQGVARRVGRALDREFGWGESGERVWRDRMLLEPGQLDSLVSVEMPEPDIDPLSKSDVYLWALTKGGIRREDLDLLIALAVTASEDGAPSRSSAGVTAKSACLQLVEPGQSADQLQYRARQALKVLREAATRTEAA